MFFSPTPPSPGTKRSNELFASGESGGEERGRARKRVETGPSFLQRCLSSSPIKVTTGYRGRDLNTGMRLKVYARSLVRRIGLERVEGKGKSCRGIEENNGRSVSNGDRGIDMIAICI